MTISRQFVQLRRVLPFLVVIAVILSACGQGTPEPSAAALMPNLPGYDVTDTLDIQNAISKAAAVASLGAQQPELTALIAGVNNLVNCYQQAGAVQGRTYVNHTDILKSGVVVIVNRNVVTDPNLFVNCVLPQAGPRLAPTLIQPCGKTYTLDKDNNQFYIGYAATNPEVCAAFCAALQGCTP